MVSIRSLALLAAASVVYGQEISSLQECGQTCYNNAVNDFARFGCGAGEISCLCKAPDWGFSIRDCAIPACGEAYASTVTSAASAVCATATIAPPPAAATSTPAGAPPTSTPPAPTSAPTTTSSSSSSSTVTSSSTEDAAKLATTSSTSSPTASPSKTSSKTSSTSKTSAPASTSSDAAAAAPTGQAGMATATKIGLGVGLTAVGAALIGGVAWFLLRRRASSRQNGGPGQGKHWKISDPMPAHSGRAYAQDYNPSYETGLSELEMKSRRYEDMVPRAKPRHMV